MRATNLCSVDYFNKTQLPAKRLEQNCRTINWHINRVMAANIEYQFLINITPIQMHIKTSNKRRTFKQYISYNI